MSSIKERLIQVVLRGKDLLSPEAKKGKEALEALRSEGEKLRAELDKAKADIGMVKALDGLNKSAERAEKDLDRAQKNVKQLQDELSKSPGSKGLEVSLKAAERESRRAATALDKVQQEATELAEKAKAAGIDTSKLSEEEKRLASQLDRTKSAIRDNSSETSSLRKEQAAAARSAAEQESRTQSLRSALSGAEKRVLAFAAAYISLNAALGLARKGFDLLASGIGSVVSLGDAAAQTSQRLAGLMGGAEAGAQAGKWIEEFADKSGRRINDITDAFVGLKAYGLDPMDGSLEALINKTTQLGGDASTLQGLSLALGQMWAKEKIVQEEVNQLRERGVNAFDLLAKAMGKTTVQIQDMAAKGQLGRNEIKLLIDEIGKSADGAAAGALDTLSGKWNVLQNQFQKFGERIASSGVMELLNEKLQGVLDTVGDLTEDGTLDNLAVAIADAFGQGAERVEEFVKSLAGVDFKQLIDDSAAWIGDFGNKLDAAALRVKYFFAPFKTGFNLLHSGFAAIGGFVLALADTVLAGVEKIGNVLPDALGGEKITAAVSEMRAAVRGTFDGLMQDILDNNADIKASWTDTTEHAIGEKKRESAEVLRLEREQAEAYKKAQEEIESVQAALRSAADEAAKASIQAAIDGKRAFTDMADAFNVIDATDSVAELEKLRQTFLQAGKDGTLSQQEMEAAVSKTSSKITQLGRDGTASAKDLKSLEGVMQAIKTAANDIDIRQAKSALDKLYREGAIDAKELKEAQDALNAKVAELKPAAEKARAGMKSLKVAADEAGESALKTNADFRMVASSTKDAGDAADSAGASFDFFGSVLSQAREPLASLSAAALDAFDAMQGISNAGSKPIDTSSYKGLRQAAEAAKRELGELRHEQDLIFNPSQQLANWALDHLIASKKIEAAALGQKARLAELTEQYQKGTISAKAFVSAANGLKASGNLLDGSDLSALQSAIDSAKQKMDQLAASTRGTFESLQDELLQLKGTQEEIEASKMASRRRDLQSQLADARKEGDDRAVKNLQAALRTLTEIEDERMRQARNAKAEEAKKAAETKAQQAAPVPAAQSGPQKVIRLEAPGGKAVNVALDSDQDEAALLGILEQYAMRTH